MGGKGLKRKTKSPPTENRPEKAIKSLKPFNPFLVLRETGKLAEETKVLVEAQKLDMANGKKDRNKEEQMEMDEQKITVTIPGQEKLKSRRGPKKNEPKKKPNRTPIPSTDDSNSDSTMTSSTESDSGDEGLKQKRKNLRKKKDKGVERSLDIKLEKLTKTLDAGKTLDAEEVNAILITFIREYRQERKERDEILEGISKEITSVKKELREAKKENQAMKQKMRKLEMEIHAPEIRLAKRTIIVRGLKEEGETEGENVKNAVNSYMKRVNMNVERVENARRLELSKIMKEKLKEAKEEPRRPLLLTFFNQSSKFEMFGKLSNLKGWTDHERVRVSNDIPLCLKAQSDELESAAREMRKSDKTVRTRVIYADLALKLQMRRLGHKEWLDCIVERKTAAKRPAE